jgi:hypothetical protein
VQEKVKLHVKKIRAACEEEKQVLTEREKKIINHKRMLWNGFDK